MTKKEEKASNIDLTYFIIQIYIHNKNVWLENEEISTYLESLFFSGEVVELQCWTD